MLVGEDAPTYARWAANGDVVAVSAGRLWRLRPKPNGETVAQTTVLPKGRPTLDTAKSADVSVVTIDKRAHVFRDGKGTSTFAIDSSFGGTISDDGSVMVVTDDRGNHRGSRAYDIASGEQLADFPELGLLSEGSGSFAITGKGIYGVRDGAVVVALDGSDHDWSRSSAWVDGKAVMWGKKELVVVDPSDRTTKRFSTSCRSSDVRDSVDAVGKHALRICGDQLFVVTIDKLVRREIHLTHGPFTPFLELAREGNAVVLDWGSSGGSKASIDEVDTETGQIRSREALPPLRSGSGEILLAPNVAASVSPDGKLLLSNGAVLDRATQRELVRWGAPDTRRARSVLVAFVHENGLEIAADIGAPSGPLMMRLGPAPRAELEVPRLTPESPCPTSDFNPSRTIIDGKEASYVWPFDHGTCACTAKGCTTSTVVAQSFSRAGQRVLARSNDSGVTISDGPSQPIQLPVPGYPRAATFLDAGRSAAIVHHENGQSNFVLREIALDTLSVTRSLVMPKLEEEESVQVLGTAGDLVFAQASLWQLDALIFPRTSSSSPRIHIIAWPGQAIAHFADGHVELSSEAAASALACLEANGTVRPFASCRDRFEAKARFRLE